MEPVGDLAPAISPDGQTVAFYRLTSGGTGDIYLVPFAGGEPRRLTFEEAWLERPAWTPDGRELVFSSGGPLSSSTLWRVSASGGKPERLPIGGDNAAQPAISSRANRLAYVQRSADANIWQLEMPRSAQTVTSSMKFIASTRHEAGPQFSRDGRRIVFASDRSGKFRDLGVRRRWTQPPSTDVLRRSKGTPRWSPDSRRIAFDARFGRAC